MPEPKIKGGYYIKARCIKNSSICKAPPYVREIWDYLLREANHSDQKYNGFIVKRGQLFKSYKDIREDLCWYVGYRKEKYNENQTKKGMRYLVKELMIATTKEPRGVLITVCNYDYFQDPKNYERAYKNSSNERTNERTNESTNERTNEGTTNGIENCCDNGHFRSPKNHERTNERTNESTNESTTRGLSINKNVKNVKNVKKEKKEKPFLSDSIEYRLANYLLKFILQRNPGYKKPNIQTWAKNIDLLLRLDKLEADDIKAVIEWSQKDLFWQNNILSTKKLRLHFDQLFLKMQEFNPSTGCKRTDANMRAGMEFLERDDDE